MRTWTVIVRYWLPTAADPEITLDTNENVDVDAGDPREAVRMALASVEIARHATSLRIECFPKSVA